MVLFERLECFFELLKRMFFILHGSIALGKYPLVPLWIIWILLVSVVPTLVKYLLVFLQFRFLFYDFLLSFYSPWGRTAFLFLFPCYSLITCHVCSVSYLYLLIVVFLWFYFNLLKKIFVLYIVFFRFSAFVV